LKFPEIFEIGNAENRLCATNDTESINSPIILETKRLLALILWGLETLPI
jgi:hypothetical protein